MKVLHINSNYATGKFYKNLTDKLNDLSIENNVFVPVPKGFKPGKFDYGNYVKIKKCYKKHDRYIFHLKHLKILKNINKQYSFDDFDLLHAHSLFSNGYIAYKLNKEFNIPYIVAVRNTDVNTFFKKIFYLRKLGINILLNASKVIFISEPYKNELLTKYIPQKYQKHINDKCVVIPNGIDDFWFDNQVTSKQPPTVPIKLLQVGDINNNKNIITTLNAVELLNSQGLETTLTAVGALKDNKLFNTIKSNDYLNYLGLLNKEELLTCYREHDIFVLPSYKETFGLVYAEALSQGLPVIYTKGQGFDKQFNEGQVGYSINPRNYNDIADKIKDIINHRKNINSNILGKFNWHSIAKKYTDMYLKIAEKRFTEVENRIL